jgi:hypothetical protein
MNLPDRAREADVNNLELASQRDLVFLVLEAQEHADALEVILAYGRLPQMMWAAGCDINQIRAMMTGAAEVN